MMPELSYKRSSDASAQLLAKLMLVLSYFSDVRAIFWCKNLVISKVLKMPELCSQQSAVGARDQLLESGNDARAQLKAKFGC